MGHIYSAFTEFTKSFRGLDKDSERGCALKNYFNKGGVISVGSALKGGWPKLIYPTVLHVDSKIKVLEDRKMLYVHQHDDWAGKHRSAKLYGLKNEVLKFSEPLYWKHLAKYASDRDYRRDADSLKLPVNVVADKKWQPMIRMFVENAEYRKNLVDTVNYSIVYKNDRRVAKYVDQLKDFRLDVSGKVLEKLKHSIDEINEQVKDLEKIKAWAKER